MYFSIYIMEGFKDHINLFNSYIDNFINDLNDNSVYEPIKYFLKLPSKRVRPILTMISMIGSAHV